MPVGGNLKRLAVALAADFASPLVGVGISDEPETVTSMRGTNGRSLNAVPFRVIPALGQISENSSKPSSQQVCDVLHDNVARSQLANDSRHLEPKTGLLSIKPGLGAGA
jgi:hypothetical protein